MQVQGSCQVCPVCKAGIDGEKVRQRPLSQGTAAHLLSLLMPAVEAIKTRRRVRPSLSHRNFSSICSVIDDRLIIQVLVVLLLCGQQRFFKDNSTRRHLCGSGLYSDLWPRWRQPGPAATA